MFNTTVSLVRCPKRKRGHSCGGELELFSPDKAGAKPYEVRAGMLRCKQCRSEFPILAGVAVLVDDVRSYLLEHVKGIAKVVPDHEIPARYRDEFLEAKEEIVTEHIEEDLEADRVTSLYLLNHYLRADRLEWWKPSHGKASPAIDALIREHWDRGPFHQIEQWVKKSGLAMVELGCGVGGLCPRLMPQLKSYLGVDSSFASIALARHLVLGAAYPGEIKIPEDLLQGPVSREVKIESPQTHDGRADFVVGDLADPPLQRGSWDVTVALNTIDMLDEPADLPKLQNALVKSGGMAIQSCPYIWHEVVARGLRKRVPKEVKDSASAVEWLYQKAGFKIGERVEHLPWLFFKHVRQLELYSVHLFTATKS